MAGVYAPVELAREPVTASPVPFVDLERHHAEIAGELREALDRVLSSGAFVLGEEVERFESAFAELCGVAHCVGVGSGTAALTLALMAAGVEEGDEVIVPAHTFIATALAVRHAGAVPVFCDVLDGTGLIDVSSAADARSSRTTAILPVHLYGQACDMDAVGAFAREHGLIVVEDAAQAHGATWAGRPVGSFGHAAAFSFYPSKNLGALGDGGAVCTGDVRIAESVRRLRNLGQRSKGEHVDAGFNERLDGVQAAFLQVKLKRLRAGNVARRGWAEIYRQTMPRESRLLRESPEAECVYHLFPVRVASRHDVKEGLRSRGIETGIHYSPAVHQQPPFQGLRPTVDLGNATRWGEEELSLPMFAELTAKEVLRVSDAFAATVAEVER